MPEITPDVLIYRVDFNNVDAQRQVKGSFAHGSSDRIPQIGERVLLEDAEGNSCWSVVRHVGSLTLRFAPDAETWTSADVLTAAGVPAAPQPSLSWSANRLVAA